jgi:hypothetical protein
MSFLRIPLDKLLDKLGVQFNPSQKAMVEGLNEHRFFVHIAARRTGKSYAAALIAFAKLLEPKQQLNLLLYQYGFTQWSCPYY